MQFGAYKIKIRISHLLEPVKRNVIKRFKTKKTDRRAVKHPVEGGLKKTC
jgi:hypothetical protein